MAECVVVIERNQARFFRCSSKSGDAEFIRSIHNPLGRERNRAFNTDKPGSEKMKVGGAVVSHAMTGEKNPHEDQTVQFLRIVAQDLVSDLQTNHYKRLIVYGDPHVSGLVAKIFGGRHLTLPIIWRHKNLSKISDIKVAGVIRSDNHLEGSPED